MFQTPPEKTDMFIYIYIHIMLYIICTGDDGLPAYFVHLYLTGVIFMVLVSEPSHEAVVVEWFNVVDSCSRIHTLIHFTENEESSPIRYRPGKIVIARSRGALPRQVHTYHPVVLFIFIIYPS
jgi:hypothetical protein